nr:MDR family MFS transporter [Actinokineospora bangkokensis]
MPRATVLLIGTLVLSAFVMVLNETIMSVALRDLTVELRVTATTVQWLTSGFLLTMAVVIPTTGYLLERFTARQVFTASLALFSLGTLISALAPGFAVLLAGRVVQASGTAMMIPLLMTSVMRLVPVDRRGATMGTISIVIAVAPAIGPTIGGAVLSSLGWRWMFWFVLPLALAALAAGVRLMRLESGSRVIPLDVLSVVLSAIGFSGVLFGLAAIGESAHGDPVLPPWAPIALGVLALVLFTWRQLRLQRDDRALLDLRPFTHRTFVVGVVLSALLFMALLGAAAIMVPLYLQTVLGESTFVTGLAMLPGGLAMGLLGRPVGRLYDRLGARTLIIPGSIALAAALWLFALLGPGSPLVAVIGIHTVLMIGIALMITPLMTDSLSSLSDHLYSHGSAILSTLQQVAGAFGSAVFVSLATLGSASDTGIPDMAGLRLGFVVAGCIALAAVAVAVLAVPKRPAPNAGAVDTEGEVGKVGEVGEVTV